MYENKVIINSRCKSKNYIKEEEKMRVVKIVFSPTGGTEKAAEKLMEVWDQKVETVNMMEYGKNFSNIRLTDEDVAVFAVPSFGGRVPAVAAQRFSKIQGNGAACILLCVYGNRAYDDTLAEMEDLAKTSGFRTVAAVAAVAEHSIARQYASGRPDETDTEHLHGFGEQIWQKLQKGTRSMTETIPGNRPYREAGGGGMIPMPTDACVKCGACAAKCPVRAIDPKDPSKVREEDCISCMGCIAACPHSARALNPMAVAKVGEMLQPVCSVRKECELYL